MKKEIAVLSPATVANVVCGFDVLGFALSDIYDRMIVRLTDEPGIRIVNRDIWDLPTDPDKNVIGGALKALLKAVDEPIGFEVESTKLIKPGSGIGSSAASAAGAVVAANELLGKPFSEMELIRFAMAGEAIASGVEHADNIAPAILGGFTLVRSLDPLDIIRLDYPPLYVTIIHPQIEIRTAEARALIQPTLPLKTGIRQWANTAALVAGLAQGDYDLIGRSMVDYIAEPARKGLIPGFDEIHQASKECGAIGGGISGSGPSLFYFCRDSFSAKALEVSAQLIYDELEILCNTYCTSIADQGVRFMIQAQDHAVYQH